MVWDQSVDSLTSVSLSVQSWAMHARLHGLLQLRHWYPCKLFSINHTHSGRAAPARCTHGAHFYHPLPTPKEDGQERKEKELAHMPMSETWAPNPMRFLLSGPEG